MAYRDGSDGLRGELLEHRARCSVEIEERAPAIRDIYARRAARTAAGAVACVGGAAMFGGALAAGLGGPRWGDSNGTDGALTAALGATWLCAIGVYALARWWAAGRFDAQLVAYLVPTGELHSDVARARQYHPRKVGAGRARRLERASAGLPLAALALLGPLSIHYVGLAVLRFEWPSAEQFDDWIVLSAIIVGHCHLVLAVLTWAFVRQICVRDDAVAVARAARAGWVAWAWTVAASVIPSAHLLGVPLVLVAVTGLFVPVAFAVMGERVRGERVAL